MIVKHGAEYEKKMVEKMGKIGDITKINKNDIGKADSENERLTIMYDVLTGVYNGKKVLGFGAGNSMQHLMDMNNTHGIYSVHGLATEIFGDFGVFIILYGAFYLYLLYKLLMLGLRVDGYNKYIAYSLFTSLIGFTIGSFSPSSVTYFVPNYLLFALCISFIQINEKGKMRYE
jgi:hypothetical protein